MPDDFVLAEPPKGASYSSGAVGPKIPIDTAFMNISTVDLQGIVAGTHKYYVWGRCEYDSEITPYVRKWVEFCFESELATDLLRRSFNEIVKVIDENDARGQKLPPPLAFNRYKRGNDDGRYDTRRQERAPHDTRSRWLPRLRWRVFWRGGRDPPSSA